MYYSMQNSLQEWADSFDNFVRNHFLCDFYMYVKGQI